MDDLSNLNSGQQWQPSRTQAQPWQYQSDADNRALLRALSSRACVWQLCITACFTCGMHVLLAWAKLSNWNDHQPIAICLFGWTHPAGYNHGGTSISEAVPVDAFFVAFIVCLGSMRQMGAVQRGWIPHVPPAALHRGPLWLLFPRGVEALPRLSSLLGVAVVWGTLWGGLALDMQVLTTAPCSPKLGTLWGGLALVLLSIAWAVHGGWGGGPNLCVEPWTYVASRAAWSTCEALLVSSGDDL